MRILISNDDGVHAPGLMKLAEALSALAEVVVVAPDRDRSAASNSLTLDAPLRVTESPNGFFAVNGTPTDSVHIAITGYLSENPDMIVTGINAGANLGDDVLYSGTVSAAMEGRFMGYPAIAFSLVKAHQTNPEIGHYYDTAATIATLLIKKLMQDPLPKDTILNVNVPDKPLSEIKGFKITRLGHRHIAEKMLASQDPRGNTIYWIGPAGREQDAGEGTDFYAINQGYVSITPLKTDLTDYGFMGALSKWSDNLDIQ